MPGGRPTKYDPEYHPAKAYEFCCEFGLTDLKLARLFDVDKATINRWKQNHPKFCDSLRAGKDEYDSEKIEKSLRRRATGFSFTEVTREVSPIADSQTGQGQLVVTKKVKRAYPPDTPAIKLWLTNRRPARWRDKRDVEVEGDLNINLIDSFSEDDG